MRFRERQQAYPLTLCLVHALTVALHPGRIYRLPGPPAHAARDRRGRFESAGARQALAEELSPRDIAQGSLLSRRSLHMSGRFVWPCAALVGAIASFCPHFNSLQKLELRNGTSFRSVLGIVSFPEPQRQLFNPSTQFSMMFDSI